MKKYVWIGVIIAVMLLPLITHSATITLQWDANTEVDLKKYTVYWGNYSGSRNKFVFTGYSTILAPRTTFTKTATGIEKWYFRVTASNDSMESLFSNMVYVNFIRVPSGLKFQKIELR